jgi:lipopolysaccharide export system protein LptC
MNHSAAIGGNDALAPDPRAAASRAPATRDRSREFRRASRHSRLIRMMRVAIPLGIAAGCALIVVVTFFNPFRLPVEVKIDPGKLLLEGTKVAMELPRIAGFTHDQRRYEVTAKAAFQDLTNPGVLEFTTIAAKVQSPSDGDITVAAKNGVYNTKQELLRLQDEIVIRTGSGLEALMQQAILDVKAGTIMSDAPVTVSLPEGTVDANRLDVSEGGSVVRFSQGVKTKLDLSAKRSGTAQAGAR